jgi:Lon protease-like protein
MNELPLFPLNTVLFPGGLLPLRLFEQRYLGMAKGCLREGSPFGVCLIREGGEVGAPATPAAVGCLAHIAEWDMQQLGVLQITARGERRFRILERRVQPDGLALASVELLEQEKDCPIPPDCARLVRLLERFFELPQMPPVETPHRLDSSAWVGARLAEIIELPLSAKQELLELDDAEARLRRLYRLLGLHLPQTGA